MPTNQKRHTCINCGSKRVEKYMKIYYRIRFSFVPRWICDTSKLTQNINGSSYCSKRTPLE